MFKKSSLLLAAVAVLAFAVPAMANATVPTLRGDVTHTTVPTGSTVRLTGTNVTIQSPTLGNITGSTITLEGDLSVNDMTNGWTIASTGGQASPPTTDWTNGTNTVIVTSVTTHLKSTVGGEVLFSFTAEIDVGIQKCVFTGTSVKGSYASGSDTLTFTKATGITGSPSVCGKSGNTLTGSFVLELASTGEALEGFF